MERERSLRRLGELHHELAELERQLGLAPRALPELTEERPVSMRAYGLVAAHGSDLISILSAAGDYLFVSPNCRRLFGYEPHQIKGRSAYEFFHPDDLARVAEDHAAHAPDRVGQVRYRFRCSDGSYRWVETRSQSRITAQGIEQIIAITRDVQEEVTASDRAREAEVELSRAQQLSSIGRLTGAVAHELANPLAAALMGLEAVLGRRVTLDADTGETLAFVHQGLARAASVLAELRVLAAETRELATIDLSLCVRDVLRVAALRVSGIVDVEADSVELEVDPARCHQLVYNLLMAHVSGLRGEDAGARIFVACAAIDGAAQLRIESDAELDRQAMVADLVSALRGEEGRYDVPLALAREIAGQLGATFRVEPSAGRTATVVRFAA